ncbi:MAG: hypothetical protein ACK4MF_01050 [Hyphomicrobiaceae bacterium]
MTMQRHLRAWSDLSAAERDRLLAEYQRVLDAEPPTCSFDTKLERMQRWLEQQGVSLSEAEIRGKARS